MAVSQPITSASKCTGVSIKREHSAPCAPSTLLRANLSLHETLTTNGLVVVRVRDEIVGRIAEHIGSSPSPRFSSNNTDILITDICVCSFSGNRIGTSRQFVDYHRCAGLARTKNVRSKHSQHTNRFSIWMNNGAVHTALRDRTVTARRRRHVQHE